MASYLNFRKETLAFRDFCSHKEFEKKTQLRDGVNEKKKFSFGHCPNDGGEGLPMPEFLGPL